MNQATLNAINSTTFKPQNRFSDLLTFAMEWIYTVDNFTTEQMRFHYENTYQTKPVEQRTWGAVIIQLRKFNLIQAVGLSKSQNKQAHSRPVYVWAKISK